MDDRGAHPPTPSEDVDCIVEVTTSLQYAEFEEKLRKLGFRDPSSEEIEQGAPLCRKYIGQITCDIMPLDPKVPGFSNQWYAEAIRHRISMNLPSGQRVFCLSLPYFFITKLEAYFQRGQRDDSRISQDLEDIANVLDGINFQEEANQFKNLSSELSKGLKNGISKLLQDEPVIIEAFEGFLRDEVRAKRALESLKVVAKMQQTKEGF
jgi:hypothetical protein